MDFNPALMTSIEKLGYSVTVGDVAANSGLEINQANQGLLALASETQGNLIVSETGDILYKFPRNFRYILTNRYWQLKVKQWLQSIWKVVFYLIRISFGIVLILSILLMVVIILVYTSSQNDNDNSSGGGNSSSDNRGGGFIFLGNPFSSFWLFSPDYESRQYALEESENTSPRKLNFLESVFSFLFGDGNPNADLEQKRWNSIGTVIRNNQNSIIAEQVAPYLDNPKNSPNEDYVIPVLARFNGYPEVSPEGEMVYYFPDLQVTAKHESEELINPYLQERSWEFTQATSGQIWGSIGLGIVNIALVFIVGSFINGPNAAALGGLGGFVSSIFSGIMFYAVAFLAVPVVRYFWLKWRNQKLNFRNLQRRETANYLQENQQNLQNKLNYARQFAQQKVITSQDVAYSTEQGLLEQSLEQSDKIDEQWRKRLES